jgi:isochorismate hydrolase
MTTAAILSEAARSHLLIVDIQEKLSAAMDEKVLAQVVTHAGILAEAAGMLDIPMVHTEQYPKGLGPTLPAVQEKLPADSPAYDKTCFSSCRAAGVDTLLDVEQRPQVLIAGMEAHVCVLQTAFDLLGKGFQPFVVGDAVCSRHKRNYKNALRRMAEAGVIVTNTESVLFEWLGDAKHAQFKAVTKLIR